jgi:hypothetical protein
LWFGFGLALLGMSAALKTIWQFRRRRRFERRLGSSAEF